MPYYHLVSNEADITKSNTMKIRVTDEVTAEIYEAENAESAVEQFLDKGYDTGDMSEDASWEGLVQTEDLERIAGYRAKADGNGGVKSWKMIP